MGAIYKREMRSYFTTPLGYIFIAAYLAVSGYLFCMFTVQNAVAGSEASPENYFTVMIFVFSVLLPLLTMRSLSEERRQKTEQLLLSAPVTLPGMVIAKFLAAYTVFAATYLVSCIDFIVLYLYKDQTKTIFASQNTAVLVGYSLAILLLGGAFLAVGIFVSSLTENQLAAAIGTMIILVVFLLIGFYNSYIDVYAIRAVLSWISVYSRFIYFTYGILDLPSMVYYVSIMAVFLFLTVRVYEKRRW